MYETNRIYYLDVLKFISIFGVIFIHLCGFSGHSEILHFRITYFSEIFRFAVPVFLMITGTLLLNREISISDFLKKRFSRIVYPKVGNAGRVKPNLDCTNQSDAFQVSNEQAKLKHKVGLITADEAVLAGMTFKNDYVSSLTTHLSYLSFRNVYGELEWTMTPLFVGGAESDPTAAKMFTIRHRTGGGLYDEEDFSVFDRALLRPVVSLKAGTTLVNNGGGAYIGGSGTDNNPYIVGFGWSSL